MTKKSKRLQKISLRVPPEDWKTIQDFYPEAGASKIMRQLLHRHAARLRELTRQRATPELLEVLEGRTAATKAEEMEDVKDADA